MRKQIKLESIETIEQIQELAVRGFTDWLQYGHVNVAERGDLLLFDYTTGAHIANRWNFFESVSRGLMINRRTGEIVARPFDKFFYWLDGGRRSSGHIVSITEKVDGSLGILYRHKGEYLVTTKGSFFSPQARWATRFLQANYDLDGLPDELTLMFEIIYPDNRIIVDYGEREDLALLAARNRFTGEFLPQFPDLYELGTCFGFNMPQVYTYNSIDDIIAETGQIDANFEGWIVEFSDGQRFKFKMDEYVEIHKLMRGLNYDDVVKQMADGSINRTLEIVPDAFLDETRQWVDDIRLAVNDLKTQVEALYANAPKDDLKMFQSWVETEHPAMAHYLMALWHDEDLEPTILLHAFQEKEVE